jgi:predicted RNA-binding protein
MTKYWIGVVSADHVKQGVEEGIMQIGHGKRIGVARQKKGDWLIYYSPRETMDSKDPLQEFTALGKIIDDQPYQLQMGEDFSPWRRNVVYEPIQPLPIRPILDELSFIKDKTHWGVAFRYGILEIPQVDYDFIAGLLRQS